jgi:hypothetical protein
VEKITRVVATVVPQLVESINHQFVDPEVVSPFPTPTANFTNPEPPIVCGPGVPIQVILIRFDHNLYD